MEHSIVIPTRNHPDRLAVCLASILEMCGSDREYEVLVLDNSDEEMRPLNAAAAASCGDPRVRHVGMTAVGLMAARHQGVAAAAGAVVSFVDDDERLLPGWFDGLRSCLADPQVALVTGPFVPVYEDKPPSWLEPLWLTDDRGRRMDYLTLLDFGDAACDIEPTLVWGGNLTVRKRVFMEVRGSHPDYLPSPWEAYQGDGEVGLGVKVGAAGYRARYSPDCAVLHSVAAERMTLDYLGRRAWFVGLHMSFTDTRRRQGLGPEHGVPDWDDCRRRSLVRRSIDRLIREANAAAGVLCRPRKRTAEQRQADEVRRFLEEARGDGYAWHQAQIARVPGLLEYVCRPDFLGANGALPSMFAAEGSSCASSGEGTGAATF